MNKILVTGVAVLDFIFHMEEFPRVPEKYRADGAFISGGGNAANAAVAIARLGGRAHLASRLGDDEVADLIFAELEREGVNTALTRRFKEHRSSFSSIFVDRAGERQIVNFRDDSLSMDAQWLGDSSGEDYCAILTDTRWPDGARIAMELAQMRGIPGVIDAEAPVNEAKEAVHAASHVAFSAQGATDFTGRSNVVEAALAAQQMLDGKVYVTDGPNGVTAVENNRPIQHPAFQVAAVDSLAAGDVWHGAFTLALGENQAERQAIQFANAAAAIKCTTLGGVRGSPNRPQVAKFLEERI